VFDDSVDMARMARFAMEFCAVESCGKCTPCRIGSTRGVEIVDRIIAARTASARDQRASPSAEAVGYLDRALYSRAPDRIDTAVPTQVALLRDLCDTMKYGSLCALGGFTPYPVLSALDHFPEDFGVAAPIPEPAE
jgi:formate dehydrogenase iron-sulfur subunit